MRHRIMARRLGMAVLLLGTTAVAYAQNPPQPAVQPQASAESEILKLNQATTEELQKARLRELVKNRPKAKEILAAADAILQNSPAKLNYNAITILAQLAHRLKDYDLAERFYEKQLDIAQKVKKSPQSILEAFDNLIILYFDAKRYDQVIDTCERFLDLKGPLELERAKPFIIERLVQAKAKKGDYDEALRITRGLLELTGNSWYFLRLRGFIEREAGKYDAAIKTFHEVLDKLESEEELDDKIRDREIDRARYVLSALYVDINDIDRAAKQLQILVKKHPDNATYKNDLGFIWCDNDMHLDEAEKLIREALELDRKEKEKLKEKGEIDEVRENAAYLDSMGWVLYKKKKYREALDYLKRAAADEEDGNHLEIWDHLGDCYMALGMIKEAIAAWEKGLTLEDVSKRDADRRRKVTLKLKQARSKQGSKKD